MAEKYLFGLRRIGEAPVVTKAMTPAEASEKNEEIEGEKRWYCLGPVEEPKGKNGKP